MRVLVNGAAGKMGRQVTLALEQESDLNLEAGVDPYFATEIDMPFPAYPTLEAALTKHSIDVVVDFTTPAVIASNIQAYLDAKLPAVVGTTGLGQDTLRELARKTAQCKGHILVAPNFAIGAVLMMRFAQETARFFPQAEIIEYHHEQKHDAPSGTAIKTAELIQDGWSTESAARPARSEPEASREHIAGVRGGQHEGVPIHSVRLPGYVAHQEIIFSLPGQNLTLRHDSTHRESFMPGVMLAIRRIHAVEGLVYGLETILF